MSDDLDFYDLLGVGRDASDDEVRTAFREQVREYHPDLNDDPRASAQFTALKKAYDTLADPKERDVYDRIGHDEYVRNRISGLPSASRWEVPDEESEDDEEEIKIFGSSGEEGATAAGTADSSTEGGESSTGTTTDPGATDGTGTTRATEQSPGGESVSSGPGGSASGTGSSGSASGTGSSGSASGTGSSGSASSDGSAGSGSSPGGFGPGAGTTDGGTNGATGSVSVSPTSTRSTATGVGTARGPRTTPAPDAPDPSSAAVGSAESDDAPEEQSAGLVPTVGGVFRRWLRRLVGWPMILYANAVYLVGVSLYAVSNAAGIESVIEGLRSAGTDPNAILAVFGTRHGIQTAPTFVLSDLSGATPAGSILPGTPPVGSVLFIAGAACLPTVYFFLVRWTRGGGRAWQPTYLYIAGAAAPAVGLILSVVVPSPLLYVDLALFVVVPVGTMVTMIYFGRVNPRVKRAIRRWRYRG